MSIKKARGTKKATVKTRAKKSSQKTKKQQVDLVEVRKDISEIVGNNGKDVTTAVVGEALKSQLAPMKYLFEMIELYPVTEGGGAQGGVPPEKDSLARTLLHRLGLPEEPVNSPEDDSPSQNIPVGSRHQRGKSLMEKGLAKEVPEIKTPKGEGKVRTRIRFLSAPPRSRRMRHSA